MAVFLCSGGGHKPLVSQNERTARRHQHHYRRRVRLASIQDPLNVMLYVIKQMLLQVLHCNCKHNTTRISIETNRLMLLKTFNHHHKTMLRDTQRTKLITSIDWNDNQLQYRERLTQYHYTITQLHSETGILRDILM